MLEEAQNWERQQTNHFVGKLVWETNQIRADSRGLHNSLHADGIMLFTIATMKTILISCPNSGLLNILNKCAQRTPIYLHK
jgi:hypothetical protein